MYGTSHAIESDQGIHFTGHYVRHMAESQNIGWQLHLPYIQQELDW